MVKELHRVPLDKVDDNLDEYTEFIRVRENGVTIIRVTDYGLVKWLLGLSVYAYNRKNYKKDSLKGYVEKWLLPSFPDALL